MNIFENINLEISKSGGSGKIELINYPMKQSIVGDKPAMIYFNGRDHSRFFPDSDMTLQVGHWWTGGRVNNIRDSFGDDKFVYDAELIAIGSHEYLVICLTAIEKTGAKVGSFDLRTMNIMKTLYIDAQTQFPELTAFSVKYSFNSDSNNIEEFCEPCQNN